MEDEEAAEIEKIHIITSRETKGDCLEHLVRRGF